MYSTFVSIWVHWTPLNQKQNNFISYHIHGAAVNRHTQTPGASCTKTMYAQTLGICPYPHKCSYVTVGDFRVDSSVIYRYPTMFSFVDVLWLTCFPSTTHAIVGALNVKNGDQEGEVGANWLSRGFVLLSSGKIKIYVCGTTPGVICVSATKLASQTGDWFSDFEHGGLDF